MTKSDMTQLIEAINKAIPVVVSEWNTKKIFQFETLVEQSFASYFANRETQEKTKMVSPIIDTIFARVMSELCDDFKIDEGKGRDYEWNGIPLENKLTLSTGNAWTGNGYKKTDFHILSKFELDENGFIVSYFSCLVNLTECQSAWSKPKNSNFSTLKFLNEDYEKISVIHGNMTKARGARSKYLNCGLIKA